MGWAEKLNLKSHWYQKHHPQPEIKIGLESALPNSADIKIIIKPKRENLWQKLFHLHSKPKSVA